MELAGTDMDMESAITNLIEGKSLLMNIHLIDLIGDLINILLINVPFIDFISNRHSNRLNSVGKC